MPVAVHVRRPSLQSNDVDVPIVQVVDGGSSSSWTRLLTCPFLRMSWLSCCKLWRVPQLQFIGRWRPIEIYSCSTLTRSAVLVLAQWQITVAFFRRP